GGVESMSRIPMGSSMAGMQPFTDHMIETYNLVPQGIAADEIAQKWGVSRAEVDDIGYESHIKAARATEAGYFKRELVPVNGTAEDGTTISVDRDQGIRASADRAKMGNLQAVFT